MSKLKKSEIAQTTTKDGRFCVPKISAPMRIGARNVFVALPNIAEYPSAATYVGGNPKNTAMTAPRLEPIEKIGAIGMSAGSHMLLLHATSSQTPAYEKINKIDTYPCHLNWAIANAPAYVTTDGEEGIPAIFQGYGPDVKLSEIFKFDSKTCPISLHHGGADIYSPNGSTPERAQDPMRDYRI